MSAKSQITDNYICSQGHRMFYSAAGRGEPILFLHGWPTSSFLWRNIISSLKGKYRTLAPDLIGFGRSDKPLDITYSVDFQANQIDNFVKQLRIDRLNLVVHDLGGPVGLLWAVRSPEKIEKLIILNTVIYPRLSLLIKLFFIAARIPVLKNRMVSPDGIKLFMRLGVNNKHVLSPEIIASYQAPFADLLSQKVLLKTITDLFPRDLREISEKLAALTMPIRIIYGQKDLLLPAVDKDLKRLMLQNTDIDLIALPCCGHFLQEDQPQLLSSLIVEFLCHH